MQRPVGVRVTFILMCLTNAMRFFYVNLQRSYGAVLLVFICGMISVGYAILWFYWQGRNWARWLVMIQCLLSFRNLTYLFHRRPLAPPIEPVLVTLEGLLAVYLIWYLNTPPAKTWFHSNRAGDPPTIRSTAG